MGSFFIPFPTLHFRFLSCGWGFNFSLTVTFLLTIVSWLRENNTLGLVKIKQKNVPLHWHDNIFKCVKRAKMQYVCSYCFVTENIRVSFWKWTCNKVAQDSCLFNVIIQWCWAKWLMEAIGVEKLKILTLFDIALHLDSLNQICVCPLYTRTLMDPTISQQNSQCCYEHRQRGEAAHIE